MSAQFDIQFPDGLALVIKASKLQRDEIQLILNQLDPENDEILKLVSVAAGTEYLFHPVQQTFGNPPTGRYRVILKEHIEDYFELCLCGSYVMWLSEKENPESRGSEVLGPWQRSFVKTEASSAGKYSICVVAGMILITLDYSHILGNFLELESSREILYTERGGLGTISGRVESMARILPFSMIAEIISVHGISGVIFTGFGWSGCVAHAAAIKFLETGRSVNKDLVVKGISFFGPLCGSPRLHEHIIQTDQLENHVTVNCDGNIFDRLLANYQRLSPLRDSSPASWDFIYRTFNSELAKCMKSATFGDLEAVQLPLAQQVQGNIAYDEGMISTCETNLESHSRLIEDGERNLRPIGTYYVKYQGDPEIHLQDSSHLLMKRLTQSQPPRWTQDYSLKNINRTQLQDLLGSDSAHRKAITLRLKPVLTSIKIVNTTQRVTLTFEGSNLEPVLLRELSQELNLTRDNIKLLPFHFRNAHCETVAGKSKLLDIQWFSNKVVVRLHHVRVPLQGFVALSTDFGVSNEIQYGAENVVHGEEFAPCRVLHPTMNAEFLSAAMLRVALCWRRIIKTTGSKPGDLSLVDLSMHKLWMVLLDIESFVINGKSELELLLERFLDGTSDITELRNECLHQFEEMSRQVTKPFKHKENLAVYALRKGVGYLGASIGALICAIGVAMAIPALILASPLIALQSHIDNAGSGAQVAAGAYTAVVGIVSLPAAVVGGISFFLARSAAEMAQYDYPTVEYKKVLTTLIRVLKGHPKEVMDEVEVLEDEVMAKFSELCPDRDLRVCTPDDVKESLRELIATDITQYEGLAAALKEVHKIQTRLCLVGRIHAVRKILQNQYMISFIGTHNAGKSTCIEHLFGMRTNGDIVARTEEPNQYVLGGWIKDLSLRNEIFGEWVQAGNDRDDLQLCAVDFPGTDDEREAIGSITGNTAELASFFVAVFQMGHIGGPQKDVIDIALEKRKPLMVVINQCDNYEREFIRPGGEARFRKDYAARLGIPGNLIHFVSAHATSGMFANSIHGVRGCLLGMISELIGDSMLNSAMAMRFIPPDVIEELERNEPQALCKPDYLGRAAASLMYNFKPVTAAALAELTAKFEVAAEDIVFRTSEVGVDIFREESSLFWVDQMRELSSSLHIDEVAYSALLQVYSIHYTRLFSEFIDSLESEYGNRGDGSLKPKVDAFVAGQLLSHMRDRLNSYFEIPRMGKESLVSDGIAVLLGFQALFHDWVDLRGHSKEIVELAVVDIMEESIDQLTELNIMQRVQTQLVWSDSPEEADTNRKSGRVSVAGSPATSGETRFGRPTFSQLSLESRDYSSEVGTERDNISLSSELCADRAVEMNMKRYRASKIRWKQYVLLKFQPCADLAPRVAIVLEAAEEEKKFTENLKEHWKPIPNQGITISISNFDTFAEELLNKFGSLTYDDMQSENITISLVGSSLSTTDLVTLAAGQINQHPAIAMLVKDGVSGFLYFDPAACFSSDKEVVARACQLYQSLGRLIGYCIVKRIDMPIKFPLTVYRILLGNRIGILDLYLIRPTLMRTLVALDDDALLEYTIFYSENADGSYRGPAVGGNVRVDEHNRMAFVSHVVRHFLCCNANVSNESNPLWHFCLGVQRFCPREVFHHFTPVVLQLRAEGITRLDGDSFVSKSYSHSRTPDEANVISMFWKVVPELDPIHALRILAFIAGTANLGSKSDELDDTRPFTVAVSSALPDTDSPVAVPSCNIILLPMYKTEEIMKEALIRTVTNLDGLQPL